MIEKFPAEQGDLGTSYFQKRPVTEMLNQGFALTFRLGGLSLIFSVIFGLLIGTLAALFREIGRASCRERV